MKLYQLMKDYADASSIKSDPESTTPELGFSLSLFHSCLIEAGVDQEDSAGTQKVAIPPRDIHPTLLGRFMVGFLPNCSITNKNEINRILFELYSFLKWLEKKDIQHGLANINFQQWVKKVSSNQERCQQLNHMLDQEAQRILDEPPPIVSTVSDTFSVAKIERDFIYLKGGSFSDQVRLRVTSDILQLLKPNDHLEMVLGDTSEKWVILECAEVFPGY